MTPTSKRKPAVKKAKPKVIKKDNVVEAKLNEIMESPSTAPSSSASKNRKKSRFSWWGVFALLLIVVFGAILLYENNTDFRLNSNKLLNAVGISQLPTESDATPATQPTFEMKLSIIYDKDHPVMKTSIESYLTNLETNLQNTKVIPTWIDKNDTAGQAMIDKLQAKFLPIFVTDASILKHPQYALFSGVVMQNNGEYQLQSEGMEYLEIPAVGDARYLGANPANAKVVIIEYSSMTCGYCKAMHTILEKVVDTYGAQVSWVIKHYDRGGIDSLLAQSIDCAADQSRIRPMLDGLFDSQADFFTAMQSAENPEAAVYDLIGKVATDAGTNSTTLLTCIKAGTYADKVAADSQEGASFGVMGTPAFFINDTFVGGATEEATFINLVDEAIKQ